MNRRKFLQAIGLTPLLAFLPLPGSVVEEAVELTVNPITNYAWEFDATGPCCPDHVILQMTNGVYETNDFNNPDGWTRIG